MKLRILREGEEMENQVMIIGQKESFIIRVLMKKMEEAGMKSCFVSASVSAIDAMWNEGSVPVYYMDSHEAIARDVLQFLKDRVLQEHKRMVFIGEKADTAEVMKMIPSDLILEIFERPLNNEAFISAMMGHFLERDLGEFKKSILVVDDDATYLNLVRDWLKDSYRVSVVNSGLQAIKWLGNNKVDLILLDHEMPVTSGPQVLEMLRSDAETASIPVMFLTGKSDKESVMQVVNLKPEGYMLKNIAKDELLQKLDTFFRKRRMAF